MTSSPDEEQPRSRRRPSTTSARPTKRRKQATITLYDAVAGRIGLEGFLNNPRPSKYRDTLSTTTSDVVPPDEVLFRHRGAPLRYEEDDIYFANRHLHQSQRLPDPDLLKALHRYASDFCHRATDDQGKQDYGSLDETALLALGILIEELAADGLGQSGDLALLEAGQAPR